MPSEPLFAPLTGVAADAPNAIAAGPFGSNLVSRDYVDSGVPVIRGQNLGGRWVSGDFVYVSPEKAERLRTNTARPGDIVFTQRGTLGQVSVVPASPYPLYVVSQSQMKLTVDPVKADPRFVYYACMALEFVAQVKNNAVAAGVPHINLGILKELRIPLLPLPLQTAAANALESLDDRIDVLRQTNATLESIAKAVFKSWFIDFDPVHAKAEGREPEGMNAATAALFPDAFEESELGLIPRGWRLDALADHITAERGLSYKGSGLCNAGEGMPMHNLNSVHEGGDYKYAGIKHYRGDYKERHVAVAGDIIVANTEQGHEHRLIGYPAIVPSRYSKAIYSHHIYRVRLKPESALTTHTLYYLLMAPSVREQIVGCANGSTVNMLKIAGLEIPRFVCPSAKVARAFEEMAVPLRSAMESNIERAELLADLRDALLPRLISGKLRAPEAQLQIEEVLA